MLRLKTDQQVREAEERAKLSGIPLSQCPTCFAFIIDDDIVSGTYRLNGEEYPCDCREQMRLRSLYLYANIPEIFQRLSWDQYEGEAAYRESVEAYLTNWLSFKIHGMGIAFLSKSLGVGKSYMSCLIGKELIKRGESVFFLPHNQMSHALRYNDENIIDKMNNMTVLILDDIQAPPHDKLEGIYAENLESVLRNRTNYNGTTIISSNLTQDELKTCYGRVWSVLEPKVMVQEIEGEDARQSFVALRTIEMALNGEVFPLV